MAKSSINFAKASSGGLAHNDRTEAPDYLLPKKFRLENDFDLSADEADKKMMSLYAEAKKNYQETTGQKLQATSYKWEAVINLNKEHTLEDVQRLTKELEKETGFTAVQIAIHNDEGRIEKDKQGHEFPIYNHHAHVTFFTLNKNGEQLYRRTIKASDRRNIEKDIFHKNKDIKKGEAGSNERKAFNKLVNAEIKNRDLKIMDTKRLSKIQTMTAKSLGMVRGKVSVKEEANKLGVSQDLDPTERLGHKQYKKTQQEQEKNILAKQKDLKAEIAELRAKLKEQGAKRGQYAKLEALNKDLKERIKSKDLTITELQAKISSKNDLVVEIDEKQDKNDLKAISNALNNDFDEPLEHISDTRDLEKYGAGASVAFKWRFEDKAKIEIEKTSVNFFQHTKKEVIKIDREDYEAFKKEILGIEKKLIQTLSKFQKAINFYKSLISKVKNFTTPKKHEIFKKKEQNKAKEKDKGFSR